MKENHPSSRDVPPRHTKQPHASHLSLSTRHCWSKTTAEGFPRAPTASDGRSSSIPAKGGMLQETKSNNETSQIHTRGMKLKGPSYHSQRHPHNPQHDELARAGTTGAPFQVGDVVHDPTGGLIMALPVGRLEGSEKSMGRLKGIPGRSR